MAKATRVNQIRERVVQSAQQIEQLSQKDVPPEEFFPDFLQLLVSALGASAAAIWTAESDGRINLTCDLALAETGILDDPAAGQKNHGIVATAMATGEANTFSPSDDRTDTPLPTDHFIVIAVLHTTDGCAGVVEIFAQAEPPTEARPGYLQFVEQMCGHASRFLERCRLRPQTESSSARFWEDFERFVLELHRSLDAGDVAMVAANDGRLLLGCDRLSVAYRRGRKTVIKAISGQDHVNPRSNLCSTMRTLIADVMATGESLTYSGTEEELAPHVEQSLGDFVQESGSRMVMVVPLVNPEPLVPRDDKDGSRKQSDKPPEVIGCLVAEQVGESQPVSELEKRIELMADQVAAALFNARIHQRVLLLPIWKALGHGLEWFQGRKLAKTLAILAGISAIVLALLFIPWEYRVEAQGRMFPNDKRTVFAPWDGEVIDVMVIGGQQVHTGQTLLKLRNDDLNAELLTQENTLNEKRQTVESLEGQMENAIRIDDRKDATRLRGQVAETMIEIEGLEKQIDILNERTESLTVRAPRDGIVVTFQGELEQLTARPVGRGEVLLEIMDDTGKWHLELEVDDRRMGHIFEAQQVPGQTNLSVEFIPATTPETSYRGTLQTLGTRTETSSEDSNIVPILVSFDPKTLRHRRVGAEVRAKIDCGERSLGYVLFGDVVETVRRFLWL
jgi:hypothetical protein